MSTVTHYRPTFPRLARSELRKLTTLRSTWVISVLTVLFYLLISFFVAEAVDSMTSYMSRRELAAFTSSYMVTSIFQIALLFGIAFGTMVMTAEYSHNTIQTSLLASRSRLSFYGAKILVLTVFWASVAATALLLSTLLINISISRHDVSLPLGEIGFWASLASCVVVIVCGALMAAGMGAVLRSTVGATTLMFGLVLILPILEVIPLDFLSDMAPYFPINVMSSAVAPREEGILGDVLLREDALSANASLAVLLVYTIVFVGAGALSLKKRDA
ncbi:ABC transporter permease subunit [Flaviflexus equikiangi]|uniref:ABC transporter permease subunit n=1 Tax=Flaviflexus equikiangi TaxID=2758573 RepID=A0ABS2TBV8_9ACTO|nr:ABC transporter permease subunit [Flaviflexus equikiangi]MBM9432136.1 ABC transporter permease subunit [Flaviflexus equikiangi]